MLSRKLIKYIQSLRHKKFRDEHNAFIAEGPKIISEFLTERSFACEMICASPGWIATNDRYLKAINIIEVDSVVLSRLSDLTTPNNVIGVFKKTPPRPLTDIKDQFVLMLDEIRDPGNLGTIIRTCDWFGVKLIACSLGCVDCYNPKVVQATMGSLGRVDVKYLDPENYFREHPAKKVYAATLGGRPLDSLGKITEGFMIIGNEGGGIRPEILKWCTDEISIPGTGKAESLNAAVAAGIILSRLS